MKNVHLMIEWNTNYFRINLRLLSNKTK